MCSFHSIQLLVWKVLTVKSIVWSRLCLEFVCSVQSTVFGVKCAVCSVECAMVLCKVQYPVSPNFGAASLWHAGWGLHHRTLHCTGKLQIALLCFTTIYVNNTFYSILPSFITTHCDDDQHIALLHLIIYHCTFWTLLYCWFTQ